jgi:hypothetical protein
MIYPFRKVLYNCREATLLSIKKEEGKITPLERLKLSYHLMFCDPCRRFIDQWKRIEKSRPQSIDPPAYKLTEESRNRIQRKIQEKE